MVGETRKGVKFGCSCEGREGRGGLERRELDGEKGREVHRWEREDEEVELGFFGLQAASTKREREGGLSPRKEKEEERRDASVGKEGRDHSRCPSSYSSIQHPPALYAVSHSSSSSVSKHPLCP